MHPKLDSDEEEEKRPKDEEDFEDEEEQHNHGGFGGFRDAQKTIMEEEKMRDYDGDNGF